MRARTRAVDSAYRRLTEERTEGTFTDEVLDDKIALSRGKSAN